MFSIVARFPRSVVTLSYVIPYGGVMSDFFVSSMYGKVIVFTNAFLAIGLKRALT